MVSIFTHKIFLEANDKYLKALDIYKSILGETHHKSIELFSKNRIEFLAK